MPVRYGLAAKPGSGVQRAAPGGAGLAGAGLQHGEPTPARPAGATALPALHDGTGPAGRQHRHQVSGRRGVEVQKHGAEYRRQWRKVHLGIDAQTLEIRAIEVTDNSVGDAPMLPELLVQIPCDEAIASVSADGAYDIRACHAAISARDAQAVIPPRSNGQPRKTTEHGAGARNEALRACRRLGWRIWKK